MDKEEKYRALSERYFNRPWSREEKETLDSIVTSQTNTEDAQIKENNPKG